MSERPDNLPARQDQILRRLHETGAVSVHELCTALGASIATIRRDLQELEERFLLRRTRGGAVPFSPMFYEPFLRDASFQDRVNSFAEEKRRIARVATDMVQVGNTVALSGGTTTAEVMRSLKVLSGITIVTNSVNVAMELSNRKDIEVVVAGGLLRGDWFTLVGPLATQCAALLFADILFLGVDGIDAERGLSCTNAQEADYLRVLVEHSKKKVVVADHSKLGTASKWLLCPTNKIDVLITDSGAKPEILGPFRDLGMEILLA